MTIRVATATRSNMMNVVEADLDGGSGAAQLAIYTGSQPANANTAASGTLLVTLTLNDPAGVQSGGVITLSVSPAISASAGNTGTAGWARLKDSAGNTVLDGSVGTTGSGADFIIDSTSITSGQAVALIATSTLTYPAS